MNKIIIGFSKQAKWNLISWLIQKFEKTPFSHAYIAWYSDSIQRKLFYEATHKGVRFVGEKLFLQDNVIIREFSFTVSADVKQRFLQWCVDHAGVSYGFGQLFRIACKRILQRLGFRKLSLKIASNQNRRMICTELAALALKEIGATPNSEISQDEIGIRELYDWIKQLHWAKR